MSSSLLPQVTTFIAEIYDSSSIMLYWDGNSSLDHVSLQRSTNGVKYTTIATDIPYVYDQEYEYWITGLTSNVYYTFRIIPYDVSGNSGTSMKTNVYLQYDLTITSFYAGTSTGVDMPLYWKGKYYSVDLQYKLSTDDDTAYSDAITIVGSSTYTFTGLDENTEYTFKLTPKYASGSSSSTSYYLTAETGYTATITEFTLDSISSFEAVISWVGKYSFIKFQYSTTGGGFKTFSTAKSDNGDISGTVTMTDLLPYTRYYFRAIPYNPSYSAGNTSSVVSGETLSGIKKFTASKITQTYSTISWIGSYITAYLYKSADDGNTYSYLQTYTDTSGSFTDTDVSEYTPYKYYLQPYGETLAGISSELYVLTDYYSTISASMGAATTNSISVSISNSGSRFKNALIQISPDSGITYYDASLVYNAGQTYTLYSAKGLGDLSQNTQYHVMVTPYSMYDISGTSPFTGSAATLGSISSFDLSMNSETSAYLSWAGYYTTSRVEYSTDSTFTTGVISAITADSNYTISGLDTKFSTYYFRVMPININGVEGAYSNVLYNPTVNTIYYNDIASSFATLNWSGTNTSVTIQTSTNGTTFTDLSGYVKTTATSATISLNGATKYVRAIPYDGNIAGTTTNTIYAPYSRGLTISSITASPSTITFKITSGGVYDYVKLQYATSSTSTSYTDVSTNITGSTVVIGTDLLPTLNTQNTTYYYTIVPYSVGYQSGVEVKVAGNISSAVYNPSISSIYISDITAATGKLKLNWSGTFSRVALYESANNSTYSQIFSTTTSATTSYTFTPANSVSSAPNYYKIIPVSDFSGVYSDMVYSPVVTDISVSAVSTSAVTLGWTGTYGNVTIQYSTVSSSSGFTDLSSNITGNRATFSALTPASVAYYFRAVPYSGGGGTAASYKITGVTSSTVYNPVVKTISMTNISTNALTLNWTGVYGNVTLQTSTDNSTFTNLPAGNVYITGTSKTLSLSTATTKYYRISPYYISDKTGAYIPGLNSSVVYNPTITNIYIGSITGSSINVCWTGTYDYVRLQYSKTGASYTDISSTVLSDNMTITSSHISDLSSQYQTYYFHVIPYSKITNTDGSISIATGSTSGTTYTPTIQSITMYSIDNTSLVLGWSGTYDNVTIQSSTTSATTGFTDLYTGITGSTKSISTIGTNTTYYRIKPYNNSSPTVNGITTTAVYIPTVSTVEITAVTKAPATISLKWTGGTYAKTAIQYSTNNVTFTDLVKNLSGTTTTITSSNISGLNTQTGTYYFRAVPYSYGYYNGVATYDISGVNTSSVYNATVSAIATSTPISNSTNTISVNYTGTYARAILYYGTVGNITSNSTTITAANAGSAVTTSVGNLASNTKYEFEIYPYNATDVSGIMSSAVNNTTISTIYGLALAYDLSSSSAYSVGLKWTNNGYTKIELYNTGALVKTLYSTDSTTYNSSTGGGEILSANSSYSYYAKVYDSIDNVEQCPSVTTYTLATADFLDISYSNIYSNNSITITWNNSGYTTFSIYNYTLYGASPSASKVVTLSSASDIKSYNSYTDVGDTLQYNKSYVYRVTLTNMVGQTVYTTITVTSLASATLSISTDTSKFTASSIPLVVSGSYSGFKVYVNDDSTGVSFSDYVIFDGSAITNVAISNINSIIGAANNQYSFKLQPYNSVGTYSNIGTAVSAKTLGTITTFYLDMVLDSSSVNLYWDGSFSSVDIETSTSSDFSTDFVCTRYSSAAGGVYNVAAPKQNTKYYFRATPINQPLLNGIDVSGVTVANDVSGTTLGTISSFKIGFVNDITASAISLAWDGSFASINIYQSADGGANYVNIGNYGGKYAIIPGLDTYKQYYYYANPVNNTNLVSYVVSPIATAMTRGTIVSFYTQSVFDSSAINLYVDGSYDAVLFSASTEPDFANIHSSVRVADSGSTIYNYAGLSQNTKYYFSATPIDYPLLDGVDACGNTVFNDASGTTLGTISEFKIGFVSDISASAISVAWDGSYSAIYIQQSSDGGANYTTLSDTYYGKYAIISGLTTYSQYYFRGLPINDISLVNPLPSQSATAQTLGTIASFYTYSVVDSSNITVYYDGSYDAVALETSTSSDFTTDLTVTRIGSAAAPATYTTRDLLPNKKYYFRVQPISYPLLDGVDACGNVVVNDVSGTTYARMTSMAIGAVADVYTNAIPVTWDGSFAEVYIYYSEDGSNYTLDVNSPYTGNYAVIYNLSTYVQYYFVAIPVNSVGIISDISSATVSAKTLGTIASFYTQSVVDSSSINIFVDGSYSAVCLECFGGSTGAISRRFPTTSDGIYYYTGLEANTTYTFLATPLDDPLLDGVDVSGVTVDNDVTGTTWGNIITFATNVLDISATYIPLKWSGVFSSVFLEYSDNSSFAYDLSSYVVYNATGTTVRDLSASTLYYFRITPINTLDVYGATSNAISEYTLGSSATLNVASNDVYSVTLYIHGGSYTSADINVSLNETMEPFTVYSTETYETLNNSYYTIRDLSANIAYYFTLTPYNAAGIKGASSNIVTSTTLGNLTSFGLNATTYDTTSSTIAVKWSGIYTSVYLEDAANTLSAFSPVGYITDTSANVSNLAPNTRYYFRATPINSAGNSGVTRGEGDISNVTLATITSRSTPTIGDVSVNIAFDGSFDTIQLYTLDNAINQRYGTEQRNSGTDISNLIPLTYYTVYFRAYNLNGVLSDTSSLIFTTLPKISRFEITTAEIATTYIPVTWEGSFNSVSFQWSTTSGGATYNKTLDAPTITTNITDLSQNTYYYIVAIPYSNTGASGVAGYTFTELSACTLPQLTDLAIDTARATTYYSIPVVWSGYYKYTVAEFSTDNAAFVSLGAIYDTSINLAGLEANKRYYFRATPVSLADVSGAALKDTSSVTLGNMTRSIYNVYDTSANFILDGSFSSIRLYSTPESIDTIYAYVNGGITTRADISGLLPNATYVFTVTPINSVGVSRTDPSNITVRTLPKIYSFSASATDPSNITLVWDGSFDSVDIYTSTSAGSYTDAAATYVNTTKSTIVSNIDYNKRYYFKIVPNGTAGYGYGVIDVSDITYSIVTKLAVSAYYDTSATVAFDGSYAAISITTNGVTNTYTKIGNTGTDISNLLPYTTYSVTSTSTNRVIVSTGLSTAFTTLPKISALSGTALDFSSISLAWSYGGNAPDYITLEWNTADTFSNTVGSGTYYSSPIYVSDLSANTRYYFRAIPYASSGVGYSTRTNVLTTANAGIFRASAVYDTSAVITFDGVYSSIDISVNSVTKTYNTSSGTTGTDISNLIPNSTYLATSIVKTSDGTTSVGNNTTFTTLPKLTGLSVSSIDNSSVNVYWTYSGVSPSSVTLIWNTTGGTYSAATDSNASYTASPAYVTGLSLANKRYYFQATPVASGGSGYSVKDASDVTYGKLTALSTYSYYDTSAVVAFDGSFASVDISTNSVSRTYTTQRTTGTDITNLVPGATYTVTTNVRNIAGYVVAGNTITFTTRSKITGFSATAVDSSSISVSWTATGTLSYVTLVWNTTGGTYGGTDSSGVFSSSPAYITGLSLANKKYYFQITPTSSVGDGYIVKDASDTTYGILTSLSTYAYYDTSAVVAFDGSFTSVDISTNNVTRRYTTQRTTGTDISNLVPGATYTVTTNVRNSAGYVVAGNTITFTTRSKITGFSATALDSSSISVAWTSTGSLSYVTLIWNTTGGTYNIATDSNATFNTSPAYISGLSLANTRYYFQITPTSSVGDGYSLKDASNVTYGTLTSLYTYSYYDTSAVIAFDGSFTSLDISTNSVSRTYTTQRTTGTDITNLVPGATYNVTTNIRNSAGATIAGNTITFTTRSKITGFSATALDSSSISVAWTATGTISYVTLVWNNTGGSYNNVTDSSGIYTSSPIYITGLSLANARYYFQITPTSAVGDGYNVKDASNVTYGKLTTLYTSAYYDTSAVIAFDGSFTSVDISTNSVTKTYTTQRTTGTDIANLVPGATYTVTSIVKNSTGATVVGNTITFTTLSKITGFSAIPLDSSSISVAWTATGAISNVNLIWNTTGGTYNAASDSSANYTTSPAYVSGLSLANSRYYFQITPTSSAGTGYSMKDASNVTFGKLTTFYVASYADVSATIVFDGSFASVDISTNSVKRVYTTQRTTATDISNLTPGTTYTVTSIVRNIIGNAIVGNSATFTTLPKLSTLTATALDSSSVSISWTYPGSLTNVNIVWNKTGGTYATTDNSGIYTTSPAYVTSLSKNTTYYFRATPTYLGGSGYTKDISMTTLVDFSGLIFFAVPYT